MCCESDSGVVLEGFSSSGSRHVPYRDRTGRSDNSVYEAFEEVNQHSYPTQITEEKIGGYVFTRENVAPSRFWLG
jgi:hypothetical protein